jgi:hypothetical protein
MLWSVLNRNLFESKVISPQKAGKFFWEFWERPWYGFGVLEILLESEELRHFPVQTENMSKISVKK